MRLRAECSPSSTAEARPRARRVSDTRLPNDTTRYGRPEAANRPGFPMCSGRYDGGNRRRKEKRPGAHTAVYHLAILYPTRAEFADALQRLMKAGVPLEGASDHGVS